MITNKPRPDVARMRAQRGAVPPVHSVLQRVAVHVLDAQLRHLALLRAQHQLALCRGRRTIAAELRWDIRHACEAIREHCRGCALSVPHEAGPQLQHAF